MSKEFDTIQKKLDSIKQALDSIEEKDTKITSQIQRIETKIDYLMNFLEEFLASDIDDEEELDPDIYDSGESWEQDPDTWKDSGYYGEEIDPDEDNDEF